MDEFGSFEGTVRTKKGFKRKLIYKGAIGRV